MQAIDETAESFYVNSCQCLGPSLARSYPASLAGLSKWIAISCRRHRPGPCRHANPTGLDVLMPIMPACPPLALPLLYLIG
jgi:hypothetical protein